MSTGLVTESTGARRRIYLSPPHMSGGEQTFVDQAFATNWVAPLGPNVEAFERELAAYVGAKDTVALNSGTAALHLALSLCGVGPGDVVLGSTFTFVASANPALYLGAEPAFIDSERRSWNVDPDLLAEDLRHRARNGKLPKAIVVVHLYGQPASMSPILELGAEYEIPVVEDAAEALGAAYGSRKVGTLARFGFYSFNGNKIITTSGGGALVCESPEDARRARKLAAQAREATPHFEHREVGYNYRLSNVLAGIGRGQLRVLADRVQRRRDIFSAYRSSLGDLPGVEFMPEASWGMHTRWLTTLTIEPTAFGAHRDHVRKELEAQGIESRPLWKPMHLQPLYRDCDCAGGRVSADLFERGLCLPSGSGLTREEMDRVVDAFRNACPASR